MEIIHGYRNNDALRRSFNELAEATFGLNFEGWYQNGFWGDCYDPWSVVVDGKVVANVSVNRTDLRMADGVHRVYQLGTVMTEEKHRNKGLSRAIMERLQQELQDAEGVYLFANDSVLDYYPKFGFVPGAEYGYSRQVSQTAPRRTAQIPMDGPAAWKRLAAAMEGNAFRTACQMVDNPGLIFFYASQFLCENVYYDAELDAWVIAELEDGELLLHNVFCPKQVTLDAVIAGFGSEVRSVTLGFAPQDPTGFVCRQLREEDSTFFVRGNLFDRFKSQKLRIPSLSHA